jgi:hypothetical protein
MRVDYNFDDSKIVSMNFAQYADLQFLLTAWSLQIIKSI